MSTKPKFLIEIERKLSKTKDKRVDDDAEKLELYQDIFSILIDNVQTFGPVLMKVKSGYERHIKELRENNRYLEITNSQLYNEMRKFQDEISSDEEEEQEAKEQVKEKLGLIEKLRIKREKEKFKRAEKLKAHLKEIDEYRQKLHDLEECQSTTEKCLKEKESKYDLLVEEFNSVQKNFSAYKASREEVCRTKVIKLIFKVNHIMP